MFSISKMDDDCVPDDDMEHKERFIMDRIFCGFLPDQKIMDLMKTLVEELKELVEEIPEEKGSVPFGVPMISINSDNVVEDVMKMKEACNDPSSMEVTECDF